MRTACIYVVVGLGCDGKKQILACISRPGRENLEDWKVVLRGLIERGLRRVMIVTAAVEHLMTRDQLARAVAPRLELAALMAYERPLPSVDNYDHLLGQEAR